jgi:hypothetical protein
MTERDPPAQRAEAACGRVAVRIAAYGAQAGRRALATLAFLAALAAPTLSHAPSRAAQAPARDMAHATVSPTVETPGGVDWPYGALSDEARSSEPLFAAVDAPLGPLFARFGQGEEPSDPAIAFGPMKVRRDVVETILRAAAATRWDPVLLMAIADKESRFQTGVQARTSSATGLFQFIDATWLKVVREFGPRHGLEKEAAAIRIDGDAPRVDDPQALAQILALRRNPYLSTLLAAEMLKRDRERIGRRIGRDLSDGETYLAHFLGPDGAENFIASLLQSPQQSAPALFPRPARANKAIFYAQAKGKKKPAGRTLAEVHDSFERMMGARLERYRAIGEAPVITAYAEVEPR